MYMMTQKIKTLQIVLPLICLLTLVQTSWTQNCDFNVRILSTSLNGDIELISPFEYQVVSKTSEKNIEFTPKSEIELTETYPEIFKLKDSCYTFVAPPDALFGMNKGQLQACKNRVQSKESSNYEFKGVYSGNALIEVTGYESWGYLSVDLNNGLTCYTMGKPMTSNGITAISYSNYYGEEQIALTDLKTKKQYVIGIEGWRTLEYVIYENMYYLKMESAFRPQCKKEIKYLKVAIQS